MRFSAKNRLLLSLRRFSQIAFSILFIVSIFSTRYPLDWFINPLVFFQLDPLLIGSTAIAERIFLGALLISGTVVVFTLFFGRFFCGWFCPLGAVMDFLALFKKKRGSGVSSRLWRKAKYALLFIIIIAALIGLQWAWFFDPLAIYFRAVSLAIHPWAHGAIDRLFQFLMENGSYNEFIGNSYYWITSNIFSPVVSSYTHGVTAFGIFIAVTFLVIIRKRFWCRYLCPLGALLALLARISPYRRRVFSCGTHCTKCQQSCRMGAIAPDNSYTPSECILCMDCVTDCPGSSTFSFRSNPNPLPLTSDKETSLPPMMTRRTTLLAGTALLLQGCAVQQHSTVVPVIPPGALEYDEFIQRCIRCGNCIRICPTDVLQPKGTEGGMAGLWVPEMNFLRGHCEYECNLCGQVCPTGAIRELTLPDKKSFILGVAVIDKEICLPWIDKNNCIVCEEHCPVPGKAIDIELHTGADGTLFQRPVIIKEKCIGCGICVNRCPVEPVRAIRISTEKELVNE